jgi:ketosteroid isomerase-like protein
MPRSRTSRPDDRAIVEALDLEYQAAVAQNDVDTMARILADGFVLISSTGRTFTKADLLEEARSGRFRYERQDDTDRTVRVWGDTAVVTALLWAKGTEAGAPFAYRVWFSDTYARQEGRWQYVLGHASGRLPYLERGDPSDQTLKDP